MVRSPRAGMTRRLPHSNRAIFDVRKLEDYCLSASHPRGRHKARVFRETLGLQRSDAPWLRDVLLEAARAGQAAHFVTDAWGSHWRLDTTIRRHGKSAVVRTIWMCDPARTCRGLSPVGCCDESGEARRERRRGISFGCGGIAG